MALEGRLDGAREVQTQLMEPLCFSKRLIPQSEESELIQIRERWLYFLDSRRILHQRTHSLARMTRLGIGLIRTERMSGRLGDSRDGWGETGRGLSLTHFQMFSSTKSSFCASLYWCSNQCSWFRTSPERSSLSALEDENSKSHFRICRWLSFAVNSISAKLAGLRLTWIELEQEQGFTKKVCTPSSATAQFLVSTGAFQSLEKVGFKSSATVAEHWSDAASPRIVWAVRSTHSGHKTSNGFHFHWEPSLGDWNWALWRAVVGSEAFTQWKCHLSHALSVCQLECVSVPRDPRGSAC